MLSDEIPDCAVPFFHFRCSDVSLSAYVVSEVDVRVFELRENHEKNIVASIFACDDVFLSPCYSTGNCEFPVASLCVAQEDIFTPLVLRAVDGTIPGQSFSECFAVSSSICECHEQFLQRGDDHSVVRDVFCHTDNSGGCSDFVGGLIEIISFSSDVSVPRVLYSTANNEATVTRSTDAPCSVCGLCSAMLSEPLGDISTKVVHHCRSVETRRSRRTHGGLPAVVTALLVSDDENDGNEIVEDDGLVGGYDRRLRASAFCPATVSAAAPGLVSNGGTQQPDGALSSHESGAASQIPFDIANGGRMRRSRRTHGGLPAVVTALLVSDDENDGNEIVEDDGLVGGYDRRLRASAFCPATVSAAAPGLVSNGGTQQPDGALSSHESGAASQIPFDIANGGRMRRSRRTHGGLPAVVTALLVSDDENDGNEIVEDDGLVGGYDRRLRASAFCPATVSAAAPGLVSNGGTQQPDGALSSHESGAASQIPFDMRMAVG
ncbi:hypothetical protein ERJ75_000926700 [Trypanosoma vivax]|nr:hypothetical protein ERJ75_000926700 [Trypanosoma vivax]